MSLRVADGVDGFHLLREGEDRGLCGASAMETSFPLHLWNVPYIGQYPFRPTYCAECERVRATEASHE